MTIVPKNSLQHATCQVGFVPVPICDGDVKLYSRLKIVASKDNCAVVFVSAREVVSASGPLQGFPLQPGESIELEIDSPKLYAVSTDYGQVLDWIAA